jgi:hypothetical protein
MNGRCCDKAKVAAYVVGLLGAFLIFAALVWAMRQYTQPAPLGEDRAAVRRKALAEIRATEADQLHNYGWVDQGKGVVRLPVAEAMVLVEREWQNPAAGRSNLLARVAQAFPPPPPKAPEKPSQYD